MTPQQRSLTMLGVMVVAMVVFGAWYVLLRPPSLPASYEFPRLLVASAEPGVLYDGALSDERGCIRAGQRLVIWPSAYSLTLEDGEAVVHGDGRDARMGETVRLGGSYYDGADLPEAAFDALEGACGGPYFVTSGFVD